MLQNNDMAHLKDLELVYCFQSSTLSAALEDWTAEQINAYPDNEQAEKNILIAAQAMRDFMCSQHVVKHGMVVKQLLDQKLKETKA